MRSLTIAIALLLAACTREMGTEADAKREAELWAAKQGVPAGWVSCNSLMPNEPRWFCRLLPNYWGEVGYPLVCQVGGGCEYLKCDAVKARLRNPGQYFCNG